MWGGNLDKEINKHKGNQTCLDNLQTIENAILKKYTPPPNGTDDEKDNYDIGYGEKYYDILYAIKNEQKKINLKIKIDDIKQNLKNIALNILWIIGCILLIKFIDNPISDWIFGIILVSNCLMLVFNSVKYYKSYKSESAKGKKAAGEGYGKFYNKIGDNNGITTAAPAIIKFIEDKKMMDINEMTDEKPVLKTFRQNVYNQYNDQYNDQNNYQNK